MKIQETSLPGVMIIEPKLYQDTRGFFYESFQHIKYQELGIKKSFVQDNVSRSAKNVLRGLHYQLKHPQAKLVFVSRGAVLDVAVDIRRGSPTFGNWISVELNDENHRQLYIPEGFAHGFLALSDEVDFFYKCTDYYDPTSEFGIRWDDPNIGITWGITDPLLSDKDSVYPLLNQLSPQQLPLYEA